MGESTTMGWCHKCHQYKPIDQFDVLETIECTSKFKMFTSNPHLVNVTSYTCKECGTTTREEWYDTWKQNC